MSDVDVPCAEYTQRLPLVRKVRKFLAGDVAEYIERLVGHDDETFELYRRLAYYLPTVPRTHDAYVGMIMTPEPTISDSADDMQPFIDDLTSDGEPFQRLCFRVVSEVVATGRCFLLVDYPHRPDADQITALDAERAGLRPYVQLYTWEQLIDWRVASVNGRRQLVSVRLLEEVIEPGASEWETVVVRYVRVLDLVKGRYRVRLFREIQSDDRRSKRSSQYEQVGGDVYPTQNGRALDRIPGLVVGASGLTATMLDLPPLMELVEISRSHLNDSALRQWALLWCGQPTLVLSGLSDPDAGVVRLGSSQGILLGESGSAQLLSLGADGVGAIQAAMEEKRRDMAAIGARVLGDESGAQISTETARIQRAGEHSVLAGIANSVADGMTQILRLMAEWAAVDAPDISVTLNTDFMPRGLQPGELAEWLGQVQAGTMPVSVALEHLKSRGVIDPQITEQEWLDGIDASMIDRPQPIYSGEPETAEEEETV